MAFEEASISSVTAVELLEGVYRRDGRVNKQLIGLSTESRVSPFGKVSVDTFWT